MRRVVVGRGAVIALVQWTLGVEWFHSRSEAGDG